MRPSKGQQGIDQQPLPRGAGNRQEEECLRAIVDNLLPAPDADLLVSIFRDGLDLEQAVEQFGCTGKEELQYRLLEAMRKLRDFRDSIWLDFPGSRQP